LSRLSKQIDSLKKELEDTQKTYKRMRSENEKLKAEKSSVSDELDTIYETLNQLEHDNIQLEHEALNAKQMIEKSKQGDKNTFLQLFTIFLVQQELSTLLEDAERKIEDYQQNEHQSGMTIKLLSETKEKLEMMRSENEMVLY
jgi:Fe2+ or Zn2+ uptake regulation protein